MKWVQDPRGGHWIEAPDGTRGPRVPYQMVAILHYEGKTYVAFTEYYADGHLATGVVHLLCKP